MYSSFYELSFVGKWNISLNERVHSNRNDAYYISFFICLPYSFVLQVWEVRSYKNYWFERFRLLYIIPKWTSTLSLPNLIIR